MIKFTEETTAPSEELPPPQSRSRRWGIKLLRELPWLLAALAVWWIVSDNQSPDIAVGEPPPPIQARIIGADAGTQEIIDTAAWRGKPLLLVFWAPWCTVCGVEMPLLGELADHLGDRARVLGVGLAGTAGEKARFVTKHAPSFPNVDADDSVARTWGLRAYPTIYLLDAEGVLRGRWVGLTTPWRLRFEVYRLLNWAQPEG
jgi:thiol-disulfide isomerase/thioredoxin